MMLSRTLFRRFSLRQTSQTVPRIPLRPSPRPFVSLPFRRFESGFHRYPPPPPPRQKPHRIIHTRYDPEQARRAKPLVTVEGISHVARHNYTKWLMVIGTGGAVVFYISNLEEVPVSGRMRFNCYSDESVEQEGHLMYRKIMEEAAAAGALLPRWDARSRMVARVMERLIPASGLEDARWEVHVIESPEKNAFVIPGGKVFVFSGILPIAKTDDGLAAILGHEIAHNLARHAAESMSKMIILAPIRWAFISLDYAGYTMGLGRIIGDFALELGIARPASRKQESEADYIGLMMMAKSCYDPKAAVGVWQRMEAAETNGIPQWLSTHPSNANRIERMQAWLPEAEAARDESGCAVTLGYSQGFHDALGGLGGWPGLSSR